MVAPTLSQVHAWQVSALTDLAILFSPDNFNTQIDHAKKFFTDNRSWQGAAHDAAYNRVGEDHDQARKIGYYIEDLNTAINQAASNIGSHRTILLGKVDDARAAGLTVNDDWSVHGTGANAVQLGQTHQDAITGAYHPFIDALSTATTKISEAAELIRTAGDLFGSDLDVNAAPTQGGRLGSEDGAAAAAAAKSKDPAAWAQVASHLPTNVLTPEQIQALKNGQDVSTLPAEVQDYYKDFFAHAGKDGTLGLSEYLSSQAQSGNPAAATQQSALADGMVAITNEHLGTGKTPDGKLTSPGSYTNLPTGVRQIISGRWENSTAYGLQNDATIPKQMQEREQLANLLSKTDPGVVGGTTFSMEASRQAASLTHYVDGNSPIANLNRSDMPLDTNSKLDTAASQFLDIGSRNHTADYQLLTGKDATTGQPIPNDLSFGANGNDYKVTGDYNQKDFANNVFGHTWSDHGKAASGLYDWTGTEIHETGPQGDLARKTVEALPSVLTPSHMPAHADPLTSSPVLDTASDGKSVFQHMTDNFNKNPELANSLARVSSGNLDALADSGNPQANVKLGLTDAQHMLFLSSQTEQGRQTIDLARQQYDSAAMYQLTQNGGHDISDPTSYVRRIADLDSHITAANSNAITYQNGNEIAHQNAQAQQSYTDTKDLADTAKKLVDAIPMSIPGGPVVSTLKGIGEDHAYSALMDQINPTPTPGQLQFNSPIEMQTAADNQFNTNLKSWSETSNQPINPNILGQYKKDYADEYYERSNELLVKNSSDLEQFANGGKQAPK